MKQLTKKLSITLLSALFLCVFAGFISETRNINGNEEKATEWVQSLGLKNKQKEKRVIKTVAGHLAAVRTWHNEHPASTVPEGINPRTGEKLSLLDRQIIADSAMPKEVHEKLMSGLRAELTAKQVEAVLDKYTVGKVAFTMKAYREIVPDMTEQEDSTLWANLKKAREIAVDYKSMKEISAIFEIYKTKNEQYLNKNGRNWHKLYGDYVRKLKAQKKTSTH